MSEFKAIKQWLSTHVKVAGACPSQDYYRWQLKRGRAVKMTPWQKLPEEARSKVEAFIALREVKPKRCYNNAYEMVQFDGMVNDRFGYVEGWAHSGVIPINHGWNTYTDSETGKVYHFDLTSEVLFGRPFGDKYMALLCLNSVELQLMVIQSRAVGEFVQSAYLKEKV